MTWREVPANEVRQTLMAASVKSCSLDLLLSFLLRYCIDVIPPFLAAMVNVSLQDGNLPAAQKAAVVTSLLKVSLDLQDLRTTGRCPTCVAFQS